MSTLTLRGARLVLPNRIATGDLQVEGGRIAAIGNLGDDPVETIDCRGLYLLPGVIDPHVHFREPGAPHKEDLESGSRAACAGGVTAFLEMPNTTPPTTTLATLADKLRRCEGRSRAHYGFFLGATPENFEQVHHARHVAGVKIFMGSSTGCLLVDDPRTLDRHFELARVPIAVHAEDQDRLQARMAAQAIRPDARLHPIIRDEEAALIATRRAIKLAERHQRRLHVLHVGTAQEVEFIRARPRDRLITCETLPQYLWLDSRDYERMGTRIQMNPPIRGAMHGEALWAGLHDGTIDCLASDHAPHTLDEKNRPYGAAPSGMPGVETSLPLMLHAAHLGRCGLRDIVRWMCEGPARCYGLIGKGRLEVGYDADLVLVDRGVEKTLCDDMVHTRAGWTPFAGWRLRGWPVMTVLGGRVAFQHGEFVEGVYGEPLRFGFGRGGPYSEEVETTLVDGFKARPWEA